jgi:hypothetical protein
MISERIKRLIQRTLNRAGLDVRRFHGDFPDLSREDLEMIRSVKTETMTPVERLCNLLEAVRFVVRHGVEGAIVECGVWRGGSMMLVANCLLRLGATDRDLYLFDTFAGMPPPSDHDVMSDGLSARVLFDRHSNGARGSNWCRAEVETVHENMKTTGYDERRVQYVDGPVEETLPGRAPEKIALLRLDTDFYESTRHELIHLFPRLVSGGVLIIDDYGSWLGCRRAVDEFVEQRGLRLLMTRVDNSCRVAIKP